MPFFMWNITEGLILCCVDLLIAYHKKNGMAWMYTVATCAILIVNFCYVLTVCKYEILSINILCRIRAFFNIRNKEKWQPSSTLFFLQTFIIIFYSIIKKC